MKALLHLPLALATLTLSTLGMARAPLELVDNLDLERYQGRWYEIALLPNRFQKRCVSDTSALYVLRDDGRVQVTNRCRQEDGRWREAEGIARKADPEGPNAALEVRFAPKWLSWLPFVWGDYRVIALDEDYQYAMVGSDNRKYLWILAREPGLDQRVFDRLRSQAEDQGFDTEKLVMSEHSDAP
ncbi:lipocalin family protein [Wenzhouxiangella limi]|uniref:Outer membrane lipoprotein Blc n=1 Tax=Wenzhouxiangella limi TaxID=2707351 RepID=A0A845UXB3_9GAMM|nr:lipocalin family protein [Wenzhouxiangella limi]NDY94872.1 lipocalin family protein [Wenzhouxiangella limi]